MIMRRCSLEEPRWHNICLIAMKKVVVLGPTEKRPIQRWIGSFGVSGTHPKRTIAGKDTPRYPASHPLRRGIFSFIGGFARNSGNDCLCVNASHAASISQATWKAKGLHEDGSIECRVFHVRHILLLLGSVMMCIAAASHAIERARCSVPTSSSGNANKMRSKSLDPGFDRLQ